MQLDQQDWLKRSEEIIVLCEIREIFFLNMILPKHRPW